MLSVEKLTTHYGPVCAVDDVSLEAPKGHRDRRPRRQRAGKTSLLRTITGLSGTAIGPGHG
jgi:ABC-type branched-subunit amino acid transport system ATPase component